MTAPGTVVTGKELAAILGCKPSYLIELKRNGRLVVAPDGKGYLRAESVALYHETKDPTRAGVAARHAAARAAAAAVVPGPSEAAAGPDASDDADVPVGPLEAPDAKRRAKALADRAEIEAKVAQRDYDLSLGRLLDAAEVEQALAAAGVTFRTGMERMVDVLAPQLAAQSDEGRCRQLLWDEVAHALEELSRAFRGTARQAGE
jgi:hypothetical protein